MKRIAVFMAIAMLITGVPLEVFAAEYDNSGFNDESDVFENMISDEISELAASDADISAEDSDQEEPLFESGSLKKPKASQMPNDAIDIDVTTMEKLYSHVGNKGYGFAFKILVDRNHPLYDYDSYKSIDLSDIRVSVDNGNTVKYDGTQISKKVYSNNGLFIPVGFLDSGITPGMKHRITVAISVVSDNNIINWYKGSMEAEFIDEDLYNQTYKWTLSYNNEQNRYFSAKKGAVTHNYRIYCDAVTEKNDTITSIALVNSKTDEAVANIDYGKYGRIYSDSVGADARYVREYVDGNRYEEGDASYWGSVMPKTYICTCDVEFELENDISDGWYDILIQLKSGGSARIKESYYATHETMVFDVGIHDDASRTIGDGVIANAGILSEYITAYIRGINISESVYPVISYKGVAATKYEVGNLERSADGFYYIYRLRWIERFSQATDSMQVTINTNRKDLEYEQSRRLSVNSVVYIIFGTSIGVQSSKKGSSLKIAENDEKRYYYLSEKFTEDADGGRIGIKYYHDEDMTNETCSKDLKYSKAYGDGSHGGFVYYRNKYSFSYSNDNGNGYTDNDLYRYAVLYKTVNGLIEKTEEINRGNNNTTDYIEAVKMTVPISDIETRFEIRELFSTNKIVEGIIPAGTKYIFNILEEEDLNKLSEIGGVFRLITYGKDGLPVVRAYVGEFPSSDDSVSRGYAASAGKYVLGGKELELNASLSGYSTNIVYTGRSYITTSDIGAEFDISTLEAAANYVIEKHGYDRVGGFLFGRGLKTGKNLSTGERWFYPTISFQSKIAKNWKLSKSEISILKKAVASINRQFKHNKMKVVIEPLNIEAAVTTAKGSFNAKGKPSVKWIKIIQGGEEKKLPKSGFTILESDPAAHTITIRGKKNYTGEVTIELK